jgi:CHASE2 domain-containing sensor protein
MTKTPRITIETSNFSMPSLTVTVNFHEQSVIRKFVDLMIAKGLARARRALEAGKDIFAKAVARARGSRCVRFVIVSLVAVTLVWTDVLGLSLASQRSLGHLANALIVRDEDFARLFVPARRGPPLAVVLVDDAYLVAREAPWPMPHEELARVLRLIARYHPRAVFLDMLFLDRHGGPYRSACPDAQGSPLQRAFADLAPAPVFIGVSPQPDLPEGILCELRRDESGASDARVRPVGLAQASAVRREGVYPLSGCVDGADECMVEERILSPAAALYAELCLSVPGRAAALPEDCDRPPIAQATFDDASTPPLALLWSVTPDTLTECEDAAATSQPGDATPCEALRKGWAAAPPEDEPCAPEGTLIDWFPNRPPPAPLRFCPPIPTVAALTLRGEAAASLAEDGLFDPRRRLLTGAVVMVGLHFDGVPDSFATPLHDSAPGVYVHAMALDNLLRFGRDYKTADRFTLFGYDLSSNWYALGCLVVLLGSYLLRRFVAPPRGAVAHVVDGALHLLVGTALALFGYFALDLAPGVALAATLFAGLPPFADAAFRPRPSTET